MPTQRKPVRRRSLLRVVTLVLAALSLVLTAAAAPRGPGPGDQASWTVAGQNVQGDRNQPAEHTVGASNVGSLKVKWAYTTHGDVSATPTVQDGVVYAPDFGGYLNAIDAATGTTIWQRKISDYDGAANAISRNSPIIVGDELIVGDLITDPALHPQGANLIAVNRWTGALLWIRQVDADPSAKITGSPTEFGGNVYVGVSSNDELNIYSPPCCTWAGKLVSVNALTGRLNWTFQTIPSSLLKACDSYSPPTGCGYSGDSIWSTPAIDPRTDSVYFGTGNNYTVTDAANACEIAARDNHTSDADCTPPDNLSDSIVSLNLRTGRLNWAHRVFAFDAWPGYCQSLPPGTPCTLPEGDDYDFGGSGPNIFTASVNGVRRDLVGVGEKSGFYWTVDAVTGDVVWDTLAGPGSFYGGIQWGTSTDGRRIYVADANGEAAPYTLTPSGATTTAGIWSALDPATGKILWQTPDPSATLPIDIGATSVANGVVYAGSLQPTGDNMFALDAATGKILWSFPSGGSVAGGPAIVDGTVYWGSGYSFASFVGGTGNDKLYAFSLNGR